MPGGYYQSNEDHQRQAASAQKICTLLFAVRYMLVNYWSVILSRRLQADCRPVDGAQIGAKEM